MLSCINDLPGIGETCQQSAPISIKSGLFLTRPDYSFATYQSFMTEADWLTAIAAGNIFPVQGLIEEEPQNFEDSIEETSTGLKIFKFEGRRGRMFKVLLPLEQHQKLREYSFANWRCFYGDINNNIIGVSDDGTTVKGFRLGFFRIPKFDDMGGVSAIQLQERSVNEWDKFAIYGTPSWLVDDLQGVLTVLLTDGAVAANSVTVTVAYEQRSQLTTAGAKKSTSISGLVAANFKILNGSTEVTTGKTVTETAVAGTYTVAATTLVAGYTVQVIPSSTALYRSNTETLAS
jgi:hypothetical protein